MRSIVAAMVDAPAYRSEFRCPYMSIEVNKNAYKYIDGINKNAYSIPVFITKEVW